MRVETRRQWLRTFRTIVAVTLATSGVWTARLSAQGTTTGAIAGRITDTTGTGIPGAQVQVTNRNTGFVINATSRANGQYFVQGLETGNTFRITVRRIGFAPQTKDVNNIVLEQVTAVNFTLVTEAVTLTTVTTQAQRTAAISEAP
ncbi:MAG TPA: carboxypeptidase-like regulatory domain-containing protein, partial [Gemmatimonadaceae bacterium]|nr:carboxypeptidase-like regulatory domain-containing protein [Gemmatimonadaceae bacterium]